MRYGYGIPIPSGQSGGGSGARSIPLRLNPSVALASEYGWLNAVGDKAGYLESVSTLRNAGTGADGIQLTESSRPLCLAHDGSNYLHLPGVSDNYASATITGAGTLATWILELKSYLTNTGANQGLYVTPTLAFALNGAGGFYINTTGAEGHFGTAPMGDQTIRIVANGTSYEVFYLSSGAWVSAGSAASASDTTVDFDQLASFGYHAVAAVWPMRGRYHHIKLWSGSDDTADPLFSIDFSTFSHRATIGLAITGQTVTINRTGDNQAVIVGKPMLRMDGVDDSFKITGTTLSGPMTLVYLRYRSAKAQASWSDSVSGHFSAAMKSGGGSSPDQLPATAGVYRKNGADIAITTQGDLYTAWADQRALFVETFTFDDATGDMEMGSLAPDYISCGDIEKIYAYPRILPAEEISLLESYLMA